MDYDIEYELIQFNDIFLKIFVIWIESKISEIVGGKKLQMHFYIVFGPIVPRLGLVTGLLIMFVCVCATGQGRMKI